jgi:hypothetical protein
MWLADAKERAEAKKEAERAAELQKEAELYGDDVVNDPSTRYVRDKLAQTQEMIERQNQAQYAREQEALSQSQQYQAQKAAQDQALAKLRTYEAELEQTNPDYKQAYDFAVKKRTDMYQKRGYSQHEAEAAVANEEAYLFAEQMQMGNNPAKVAYDMAIEWGWSPEKAQQANVPLNTQRLQAGVQSGGVGQMPGQAGAAPSEGGTITAEQFFKTVPDGVRMKVLADPDKFEELGRTGKCSHEGVGRPRQVRGVGPHWQDQSQLVVHASPGRLKSRRLAFPVGVITEASGHDSPSTTALRGCGPLVTWTFV